MSVAQQTTTFRRQLDEPEAYDDDALDADSRRLQTEESSSGDVTINVVNVTVNATQMGGLSDAVQGGIDQLSKALLSESVAGEEYVVGSARLSLKAKRDTPSSLANSTIAASAPNSSDGGAIVRLPNLVDAYGDDPVDVQLTSFGLNLRGYAPSAQSVCQEASPEDSAQEGSTSAAGTVIGGCFNGVASNSTTLTLRRGDDELPTGNVSEPFILGFTISLPAGLAATSSTCYGRARLHRASSRFESSITLI